MSTSISAGMVISLVSQFLAVPLFPCFFCSLIPGLIKLKIPDFCFYLYTVSTVLYDTTIPYYLVSFIEISKHMTYLLSISPQLSGTSQDSVDRKFIWQWKFLSGQYCIVIASIKDFVTFKPGISPYS